MSTRTLAIWCPDWPVVAARREDPELARRPVAVLAKARVLAASAEARAERVVAGIRRREAEARCPGIAVVEADPAAEVRAFEAVVRAVETFTPRVEIDRPGLLAIPTRGPSRYFGGDAALIEVVREAVLATGVPEVRLGIADGGFAARLAARREEVVPGGGTPAFLAPWSVSLLGDPDLAGVLVRLGIHTLGDLAALPAASVLARFGTPGIVAHRLAHGEEPHPPALTTPPPDLVESSELDPPADRVDAAAFVGKALADRLLDRLASRGLACTRVVIHCETEHGESYARCWRHEGALTPAALAERVRWQLDGWLTAQGGLSGGLTLLRLIPDEVIPASGRQLGFWGGDQAGADRAARVFARLQGMLGPDAVVTPSACGGRAPVERVRWIPWGEPRPADDGVAPWPGAVPGPAPTRVLDPPIAAQLLDATGAPVLVSARGEASAVPAVLRCGALPGQGGPVRAWAGPWAQDVRWWDPAGERRVLWHLVVGDGRDDDAAAVACLVRLEQGRATLDALYD